MNHLNEASPVIRSLSKRTLTRIWLGGSPGREDASRAFTQGGRLICPFLRPTSSPTASTHPVKGAEALFSAIDG